MSKAWPFGEDSDQDELLTPLRVAVAGPYAEWNYIVTYDRESPVRPTEQEALMLGSYLEEYREYFYNERWIMLMAERPVDVDGGANGVTFRKYADDDWGYRRRSWHIGPEVVPAPPVMKDRGIGPLSLERLMDHIHSIDDEPQPRWVDWKKNHPDIFGGRQ